MESGYNYTVKDFYNLYLGKNMRGYLWTTPSENPDNFYLRQRRSSYENWAKKGIQIYMGYIFYNAYVSAEIYGNVRIKETARKAVLHSLIGGKSYIFVGKDGIRVLSLQDVSFHDDGTIEFKDPETIVDIKNKKVIQKTASGIINEKLIDGQFQCLEWNEDGLSLLSDVTSTFIKIYNFESIKDDLKLLSRSFNPVGTQLENEEPPKIGDLIKLPIGGSFDYKMPMTEEKISKFMEDNDRLINHAGRTLGIEAEFNEELGGRYVGSASKAYSIIDTNSIILNAANNCSVVMNVALRTYSILSGQNGEPATIKLDPFLRPDGNTQTINEYILAAKSANVPSAYKAAKKEIVKIRFSSLPKDEVDKILQEVEQTGGTPFYNEFADQGGTV
jgi:hypothetical protein